MRPVSLRCGRLPFILLTCLIFDGCAFDPDLPSQASQLQRLVFQRDQYQKLSEITIPIDEILNDTELSLFPDGQRLAVIKGSKSLVIYDTTTGRELATLQSKQEELKIVSVSPDGKLLVTIGYDGERLGSKGTLVLWDSRLHTIVAQREMGTVTVDWSPDSKRLLVNGGSSIEVIEVPTLRNVADIKLPGRFAHVYSGRFSPSGDVFCTVNNDESKSVCVWDAKTNKRLHRLSGHPSGVICLAFAPNGKHLVTGGLTAGQAVDGRLKCLIIWDTKMWSIVKRVKCNYDIVEVRWSADGKTVEALDRFNVNVIDRQSGKYLARQKRSVVPDMITMPDWSHVVTYKHGREETKQLIVWKRK